MNIHSVEGDDSCVLLSAGVKEFAKLKLETKEMVWKSTNVHSGLLTDHVVCSLVAGKFASTSGSELFVWDYSTGEKLLAISNQPPQFKGGSYAGQKKVFFFKISHLTCKPFYSFI